MVALVIHSGSASRQANCRVLSGSGIYIIVGYEEKREDHRRTEAEGEKRAAKSSKDENAGYCRRIWYLEEKPSKPTHDMKIALLSTAKR